MSGASKAALVLSKNHDDFLQQFKHNSTYNNDVKDSDLLREIVFGKEDLEYKPFIRALAKDSKSLLDKLLKIKSGENNDIIISPDIKLTPDEIKHLLLKYNPDPDNSDKEFMLLQNLNEEQILAALEGDQELKDGVEVLVLSLVITLMNKQIENIYKESENNENKLSLEKFWDFRDHITRKDFLSADFAKQNISAITNIFYLLQKDHGKSVDNELVNKKIMILAALPEAVSQCPQGAQNGLKAIIQNFFISQNSVLSQLSRYANHIIGLNPSNNVHQLQASFLLAKKLGFNMVVGKQTYMVDGYICLENIR